MNKTAILSKPSAVPSSSIPEWDKHNATVVSEDEVSKSSLEEVVKVLQEWEQEENYDDDDDIIMSDDAELLQTDAALLDSVSLDFNEGDDSHALSSLTLPDFPMSGIGCGNHTNESADYSDDSSSSCLYSEFERQLRVASMNLSFAMEQSRESRICYSVALNSGNRNFNGGKYLEKVEESREELKRRNVLDQVQESRARIKESLTPMMNSSLDVPMEIEF
jgi:hypothetical protein|mmetsp:Transcript_31781/g.48745  ORF Transcript_31781/g.48745 Transcript_31781/m.48745 type:complete len:220 (-) Transcript_31781:337-996(-)|eukprot:CAMPEP_0195294292 /NCGR_PEP_ID=MMETSP0707-20130614/14591_1 /TAXON_ID=33640 /ORGANISM="Asterionellopsis glacialis, Strain CCMP134" /LENGTH=219 /DNA_ID=CAMNT_0040355221 /DNA_START=27 /DNA_END=686 /DNA_ORIENTATION=-